VRRSIDAGRPVVLGLVGARARLSELRLAVRGPAGENLDRFLGGDGDHTYRSRPGPWTVELTVEVTPLDA
jgi:hypothetical protein